MTVLVNSPHSGGRQSSGAVEGGSLAERRAWMVTFSVTQDPSSESLACSAIVRGHDMRDKGEGDGEVIRSSAHWCGSRVKCWWGGGRAHSQARYNVH